LKDALQKVLVRLHKAAGVVRRQRRSRPSFEESIPQNSTGETVYGDRPLRLRNLVMPESYELAFIDPASLTDGFKIRVARLPERTRDSVSLVENRYGAVGYSVPAYKADPNLLTFVAYDEGTLVGTVSVRRDSSERLSADTLYKDELDVLRKAGSRLCEFTRLAANRSVASKPVLAGLFHTAYLYASVIHRCTHGVIEVTPEHAAFYHRALRFEKIGSERLNPRVNTQGVLMCVSFKAIAEGLAKYAGKPEVPGARGSLFVYGFPPEGEASVLNRLRKRIGAPA